MQHDFHPLPQDKVRLRPYWLSKLSALWKCRFFIDKRSV
jgi:hypothetical protein